jgi:glycosyltransferase involved in cell wall biosynthesis
VPDEGRARFRLAAVTSHPVQYQAPLFRRLAAHPEIELTVFYGERWGLDTCFDPDFGVDLRWDVPLTAGYAARFLPNRGWGDGFFRVLNPGVVGALGRGRFDAVLVHSYAHATALLAYLGAALGRIPVLLRTESERLRPRPLRVRAARRVLLAPLLRSTAAVLAIGSTNREFYLHHGVPPERTFWTPYGVDNDFFATFARERARHRCEVRSELGLAPDAPVVLFAGKLIPRKRPADLIDAVAALATAPRPSLLFVGAGALRGALETRARAAAVGSRFVGFRNQSEIGRYYAAADVFVLPSEFETWGLVLNEAMACGLPVVASTGAGATRDLVVEGVNGFACPAGDVATIARALARLLGDAAFRERAGRASREIVDRCSIERSVEGIGRALAYVTGRRSPEVAVPPRAVSVGELRR